jgi:NADP-dependent 3-hydroxy acid dehydrogenase YdfG
MFAVLIAVPAAAHWRLGLNSTAPHPAPMGIEMPHSTGRPPRAVTRSARRDLPQIGGDMTDRLEGAVALVTGASSGIGEATARALADRGAAVAIGARRKHRLDELAQEIRQRGGQALAIEMDVTVQEQAAGAVQRTVDELGRLDIVVNNAGVMLLGPILGAPLEEWDRMIALNLQGLLYTTHAALPHLLHAAEDPQRGVADLINISSVAGRVARSGSGVYNLTKHGVGAFSESLRQELATRHVRVSLVEPGAVDTELPNHLREEVRQQMMKRFGDIERLEAEDIASAIAYIVTRPRRVAINEVLIRPTEQTG